MTIYYVNHYANPTYTGETGRAFNLAKQLAQRGDRLIVVCASTVHNSLKGSTKIEVENIREISGTSFIFLQAPKYTGNGLSRLINMLSFSCRIPRLWYKIREGLLPKPDVIIASSVHPFVFPPSRWLAYCCGAHIFFEVRDLWPLSLIEINGISKWHPLVLVLGMIEKTAYKQSNKVISLLANARPYMESKGLNEGKFCYITNGIDESEWGQPLPRIRDEIVLEIDRLHRLKRTIIIYSGSIGRPNGLDVLVGLQEIIGSSPPDFHFLVLGEGDQKEKLESAIINKKIQYITVFPKVPKPELIAVFQEIDACFLAILDRPIYNYGIAMNKLGDYLMSKKPVLLSSNLERDPISAAHCGYKCQAESPRALHEVIMALVKTPHAIRLQMGQAGRSYALENLSWQVLGQKYWNQLHEEIQNA